MLVATDQGISLVDDLPAVNSIRVYLAGRFSLKSYIKGLSLGLRNSGIVVTSRWLDENIDDDCELTDVSDEYIASVAVIDVEDIDAAEYFLLFSESPLQSFKRGGRHFETGYAYAKGKKIIVCGPTENVFHSLPGVVRFPDWDEAKKFLEQEQKRRWV